jgi:hypothetical protein
MVKQVDWLCQDIKQSSYQGQASQRMRRLKEVPKTEFPSTMKEWINAISFAGKMFSFKTKRMFHDCLPSMVWQCNVPLFTWWCCNHFPLHMTFYNHECKLCHPRRWVCHTSSKLQVSRVRKEFWRWPSAPALDCQTRPRNRIYLVVKTRISGALIFLESLDKSAAPKFEALCWEILQHKVTMTMLHQIMLPLLLTTMLSPWHTSSMDRRTCKDTKPANSPILHSGVAESFSM